MTIYDLKRWLLKLYNILQRANVLHLLILFCALNISNAQPEPPRVEWSRIYGGNNSFGKSVIQSNDGGYVIVGNYTPSDTWHDDVYLIKTNSNGIIQWHKTFGGDYSDYGRSVQQTNDNGFIIVGRYYYPNSEGSIYLIKTDSEGNEQWSKTFGNMYYFDDGWSVQQTNDDGFIIAGVSEYRENTGHRNIDVILVKTDSYGNKEWEKLFGSDADFGHNDDYGYSLQITNDGGYIIAGYSVSYASGKDVYLIKTDSDGNETWEKFYGGSNDDYGREIKQTNDNGYIITGATNSFGAESFDVYLLKTDSNGNELWSKTFGGSGNDEGYSVQQTNDGGFIISGFTNTYGGGNYDVYLIKTDSVGNEIWHSTYDANGSEYAYSVRQAIDNGYIIVGKTGPYGSANTEVYLIKTERESPFVITSPREGEVYSTNRTYRIKWTYESEIENDTSIIEYSIDNGTSWIEIEGSIPVNRGYFDWSVPRSPSNLAKIKISSIQNPQFYDMSNGVFSIISFNSKSHPYFNFWYYNDTFSGSWPDYFPTADGYLYLVDQSPSTMITLANGIYTTDTSTIYPHLTHGNWNFHLTAVQSGNIVQNSQINFPFNVNKSPPIVISDSHPDTANSYLMKDFIAPILLGTDISNSSAAKYFYIINESPYSVPTFSDSSSTDSIITVTGNSPGTHWFHTIIEDTKGNISKPTHYKFIVDEAAPNLTSQSHPDTSNFYAEKDVLFSWQEVPDMPENLIESYYYEFDQNESTIPTLASINTLNSQVEINNASPGIYYFHLRSKDKYGYLSPATNLQVKIRQSYAPVIESLTHPDPNQDYSGQNVQFNWTDPDGLSEIYYYVFDKYPGTVPVDTNLSTISQSLNLFGVEEGVHFLHIVSKDKYGYYSDVGHFRVNVISGAATDFITLVSPLGGETWRAGTTEQIEWNAIIIDKISIDYTLNDGIDWLNAISSISASEGKYNWTIPNNPTTNCKIRIRDHNNSGVFDESTNSFTIIPASLAVISLSTNALLFGEVAINSSENLPLSISNTGSENLIISSISNDSTVFSSNPQSMTLLPGNNTQLDITFTPTMESVYSDTLKIFHNAPNSPTEVNLSGTGYIKVLKISTTDIDFENVLVGDTKQKLITLRNLNTQPLSITNITFSNASFSTSQTSFFISVGDSQSANIIFNPTSELEYNEEAYIAYEGPGSPETIGLLGNGFSYPSTITLSHTKSFGSTSNIANYRIIGLPGQTNSSIKQHVSGEYPYDWTAYWDRGTANNYQVAYDGSVSFNFTPGKAFWVISLNAFNYAKVVGSVPLSTDYTYSIPLHNSWNLISNPYNKAVAWSKVQEANNLAQNQIIYAWNGSWSNQTVMAPYEGYYFNNTGNLSSLKIPYEPNTASSVRSMSKVLNSNVNTFNVKNYLRLSLMYEDGETSQITIGIDEKSKNGFDELDYFSAPSDFENLRISLLNNKLPKREQHLFIEQRPEIGEGQIFDAEIKTIPNKEITLTTDGLENFEDYEVYLLEERLSKLYNLKDDLEISLTSLHQFNQYKILIGSVNFINRIKKELLPSEYILYQNYPNPFNPRTLFRFSLPEKSKVNLNVYSILGELVETIISNEVYDIGNYEVEFRADGLASGIYVYRLIADDFVDSKKMILLK
jgi:hypothetical protein